MIQDDPNLLGDTASMIIATATEAALQQAGPLQEPSTSTVILLPNSIDGTQKSGPLETATVAKRRGRPSGIRKTMGKHKNVGGSASKRIMSIIQASPARQTSTPSNGTKTRAIPQSPAITQVGAALHVASKAPLKSPGFRIPGNPLP